MTDSWQLQKTRIGRTDYIDADRIAARHLVVADISNSGVLLVAGNVTAQAFHTHSDASLKDNVTTISGALESVGQLRGVQYNFISDASAVTHRGVIAQELEVVYPEMVGTIPGSEKKSVAYMELIGVLIEAVKELSGRVSTLETEVAALKSA